MRNASVSGTTLNLVGDFNATTPIEIIGGAPANLTKLNINGNSTSFKQDSYGVVTATVQFNAPNITVPSLSSAKWKYIDSLPEIQSTYDDSLWPVANLTSSHNDHAMLRTPVSLFGSDYGFNTGILVFRGSFTANGKESHFFLETQGGTAFGTSVWINSTYMGSFIGNPADENGNKTYPVSKLKANETYVFTILVDEMGLDENYVIGQNEMKNPRGILRYSLGGHSTKDISWKITGNLGGQQYLEKALGPLNEGGLWAERQGYYLPGTPTSNWTSSGGPTEGITKAGVAWYATEIDLDLPSGWDIPISVTFTNTSSPNGAPNSAPAFRVEIFVNGLQVSTCL